MQMTNTYVLEKRTSEIIWYDIDCTNLLDTEEIIDDILSVTADQPGLVLLGPATNSTPVTFPDGVIAPAYKVISVQISEGVIQPPQVNQLYTIRALFHTDQGNTREATVLLNVTDLPIQTGRIC